VNVNVNVNVNVPVFTPTASHFPKIMAAERHGRGVERQL
jgi:hypothetical protein